MAGESDKEWDNHLDALQRSTQHQWMDEPRYKRLFRDIEDRISGCLAGANMNGQIDEFSTVCSIKAHFSLCIN